MTVHLERQGRVALVVVDRPERRNALDRAACDEIAAAVSAAVTGPEAARALVVAGAGPHFCAGADLGGVDDASFAEVLGRALRALAGAPVATLAAVQGAALGAGTQLAVACDLRVAAPTARFGVPAARLGLMVDHWSVRRLAATAGESPARAMLLAGEEFDGEAAHRVGFVHRLAAGSDADAVRSAALEWAAEIADLAPLTVAGHKLGLEVAAVAGDADVPAGYAEAFRRAWTSRDLAEGMAARAERRPPRFEGR